MASLGRSARRRVVKVGNEVTANDDDNGCCLPLSLRVSLLSAFCNDTSCSSLEIDDEAGSICSVRPFVSDNNAACRGSVLLLVLVRDDPDPRAYSYEGCDGKKDSEASEKWNKPATKISGKRESRCPTHSGKNDPGSSISFHHTNALVRLLIGKGRRRGPTQTTVGIDGQLQTDDEKTIVAINFFRTLADGSAIKTHHQR